MKHRNSLLIVAALALGANAPALAGGPIAQCAPGQAFVWGGGGAAIPYNPDQGSLVTAGDNATAVQLVADAFQVWADVPTSTVNYVNAGPLPEDVTGANVIDYWLEPAPDGLSPIIFDFDGSAGATLGFPAGVLGVAGIAWVNTLTCEVSEGAALLIGPTFAGDPTAAFDVTVHEFGHYSGLGHTVVNGQIYLGSVGGDDSGPSPNGTFDPVPNPFTEVVETMYPFYYGPPIGTATLHKDDAAAISELYPDASFAATTGTIAGSILVGSTPATGANVIARNLADPYLDAVSAISGDQSVGADGFDGRYTLSGLTPGAEYAVYVDEILAGGFSTPPLSPLPGPEEFYNGASESADPDIDDPAVFTPIVAAAGVVADGNDIVFNQPRPGDPLPVGDGGSVQSALPFNFCIHGQSFGSVFVNANGHLTFGAGNADFTESAADFTGGPPRIAGLWDDLQPFDLFGNPQGQVFYGVTDESFTATWENVPEWSFPVGIGSNTFSITLYDNSEQCAMERGGAANNPGNADVAVEYVSITATDGLAGITGGIAVTSGVEEEVDLTDLANDGRKKIQLDKSAAVYELFTFFEADNDLDGQTLKYSKVGRNFDDKFEDNDSLERARKLTAPFASTDTKRDYTAIDPPAGDIDFFRFQADAGKYLILETTTGQVDTVLGLYYCPPTGEVDAGIDRCDSDTAILIGLNDDFSGLLSRIEGTLPVTGTYAIAVTYCCDYDFDGVDPGQGLPFDGGRYVLSLQLFDGFPLTLGDDSSVELFGFGFSVPFGGASYDSVFVNSNGNVTFGAPSFDFSPSVAEFESGPPRAAPLWADLSPNFGGLVLVNTDFASELTISFTDVPEWPGVGANSFSVTFTAGGEIRYDYEGVSATTPLVGGAEGNGEASTATDFSATGGGALADSPVEDFGATGGYDLGNPATLTITQ